MFPGRSTAPRSHPTASPPRSHPAYLRRKRKVDAYDNYAKNKKNWRVASLVYHILPNQKINEKRETKIKST